MSDLLASDRVFSEEDTNILRKVVDRMIPAGGERPSAADPLIFADILQTGATQAQALLQVVEQARNTGIESLVEARGAHVRVLVSVTVQCYYRDDRVMRAIGIEPRPPHPQGYDAPEGDWSLLDPVRKRGRLYREV